jgi:hypothetical protein
VGLCVEPSRNLPPFGRFSSLSGPLSLSTRPLAPLQPAGRPWGSSSSGPRTKLPCLRRFCAPSRRPSVGSAACPPFRAAAAPRPAQGFSLCSEAVHPLAEVHPHLVVALDWLAARWGAVWKGEGRGASGCSSQPLSLPLWAHRRFPTPQRRPPDALACAASTLEWIALM